MDTRKIIEHFAKKEERYDVANKINSALQSYFIEDIPEEEALEVVVELHNLSKLEHSTIDHRHVGDGEYTIDTPVNQIYFKLKALTYLHPEKEFVQEYLDKLCKEYSEDEQEFSYSYGKNKVDFFEYIPDFDSNPEIHANYMENYFTDNNIPFHPSFLLFKDFEKLVNNLSNNPQDIENLQNFWEYNSKILKTSCSNPDIWTIPELYSPFPSRKEIISNINKANNLMIVETRARIAKELFKSFLNYPEMQDKLSERFPLFFKFSAWMKPIDRKGFHCQLEQHHIEVLSTYKQRKGYSSYINNTFGVNMEEYEKYSLLLTNLARKASLYKKLFDSPNDDSINKVFNDCHSLSELLKKTSPDKFSNISSYKVRNEKKELFMKFVDTLIIEAEHDELQKELPTNPGVEVKRIKL